MANPAHRSSYSLEDYLRLERWSPVKHEYLDGQIYAMAGGTPDHAALAGAFITLIGGQLKGGRCRVLTSDLRVRVPTSGLETYPDVTVICGPRQIDPRDEHAVNNPTLIVEVLSPTTEEYDRTDKFEHYKALSSLRQYVLVAQDTRTVEVRSRSESGEWTSRVYRDDEVAELPSIAARLDLRELYEAAAEPRA